MAEEKDSYGFDPEFERQVGLMMAIAPKFVGTVGHAIDPGGIVDPSVRLVIKVVRQIFKETGRGPSAPSIVMQRLYRLNEEGKVKQKQLDSVVDLLIETEPADEWDITHELLPVVKRRMHSEVVTEAMQEYGRRGDFTGIREKLSFIESVGESDQAVGIRLGSESFIEIDRQRRLHRMPTGISELDSVLRGGPPRGTLTMFIAGPGGGKSMMLSHMAAQNWANGMFVAYATLELPEFEIASRVKANLTGVPTDDIAAGRFKKVKRRLERMHPLLGTFIVQYFSAKKTSAQDIIRWVKKCEELEGYKVDLLIVDYIDKLSGPKNSRDNEYIIQGAQAEEVRLFVKEEGKWGATASQATIKGRDTRKRITMNDVRDSSRKVDVSDLVIPITRQDDMLEYGIDKNRYGASGEVIGPLAHDWERGRMVVMDDG